jgi:hypothetical protein
MRGYQLFLARAEASLAVLTAFLGILTIFWRDWIEGLTGWDGDHHSGSAEIGLVCALLAVSVTMSAVAYVSHRRLRAVTSA